MLMLSFTHSNFQLDLTYLQVTFNEQNQWFSSEITKEISFPFNLSLKEEFAKNPDFSAHYNAHGNKTVFSGLLDCDGKVSPVTLKIQTVQGDFADAIISNEDTGFPNFGKKLSELPLEYKLVDSIVEDAVEVIEKDYPETNYNFPMLHTDNYDPTSSEWNGFEKIINNYREDAFVENELELDSNVDLIKNIVQPLPNMLYVLQTAVEDAGFTLAGDVLLDYDLKTGYLWRDGSYYKQLNEDKIPFRFFNNEWDEEPTVVNGIQHVLFTKAITIEKKGNYILFGNLFTLIWKGLAGINASDIFITLSKSSGGVTTELFHAEVNGSDSADPLYTKIKNYLIDIEVSFEAGDTFNLTKLEAKRDSVPSETPDYPEACSLDIIPIRYLNPDGSPILSTLNLNEIDLKKVVPDVTVSEYVTAIKNWFFYDWVVSGSVVTMNHVQPQINRANAIDLRNEDIDEPVRTFHQDRTFELAFKDGKSKSEYTYDSIFVTTEGNIVNDYKVKETTSSIEIDLLPYPQETRSGVTTAYAFDDESSKIRVVFFRAMAEGGIPATFHNPDVLIPTILSKYYQLWLTYRINSVEFQWDFLISVEKWREISIQSVIYAYDNYHLFTEVERERIDHMWWRINAKTESL